MEKKPDITLKDVIQYFFDRGVPIMRVYDKKTDKAYLKREVESYNEDTGDFCLSGCKAKFNLNDTHLEVTVSCLDKGMPDMICERYLGMNFETTQNYIDNAMGKDGTFVEEIGGPWMKYTGSHPRKIRLYINGVEVESINTYGTNTNVRIDGWEVGYRYSNTSNRWRGRAGFYHDKAVFYNGNVMKY